MAKTNSSSLASRAVLALVLMVGFYVLAIGIAAALLFLIYLQVINDSFSIKISIFCLIGAGIIIWSILPRIDRFVPPGPRLKPEDHPRLFAELESIAKETGQEKPAEVYAFMDVNAWVSQRGGMMGLGSRRIMGIGLPLMKVLTVSQLQAVLAHEFGHYYGGDTKLGPWVFKTRAAIIRTFAGLSGQGSILQLPFKAYGLMYLRVTQGISRQQEYSADALAARVAGSQNAIAALRTIHGAGPAWESYWRSEASPALSSGYRPPMIDGFGQFLRTKSIAERVNRLIEDQSRQSHTDKYDSHPSLRDRIAALEKLPAGNGPGQEPEAISLLENMPQIEASLLDQIARDNHLSELKPVQWNEVAAKVYLPQWEQTVNHQKFALSGLKPENLPETIRNLDAFKSKMAGIENITGEDQSAFCQRTIGAALTVALVSRGWEVHTGPGEDILLCRDGKTINAFEVVSDLQQQKLSGESWQAVCQESGIGGLDLGNIADKKPVN